MDVARRRVALTVGGAVLLAAALGIVWDRSSGREVGDGLLGRACSHLDTAARAAWWVAADEAPGEVDVVRIVDGDPLDDELATSTFAQPLTDYRQLVQEELLARAEGGAAGTPATDWDAVVEVGRELWTRWGCWAAAGEPPPGWLVVER